MNIGFAAEVMNFVVLTAVLSCLNSGLYTASRMLFVLAARNEAPERLLKLNRKGVPAWAILSSTVVGFLCVIAAAVSPEDPVPGRQPARACARATSSSASTARSRASSPPSTTPAAPGQIAKRRVPLESPAGHTASATFAA